MVHIMVRVGVQDLPAFISVFSTRGAMMRKKHGSISSSLFTVNGSEDDVLLLLEWGSREAFQEFLDDPVVKDTMKSSGITGLPEITFLHKVADFPG